MMLTRCPVCATAFRITTEQLKARQGRVRCGRCQHVFNALDGLIEDTPTIMPFEPPVRARPKAPPVEAPPPVPPPEVAESPAEEPAREEEPAQAAEPAEPVPAAEDEAPVPAEPPAETEELPAAPEAPPPAVQAPVSVQWTREIEPQMPVEAEPEPAPAVLPPPLLPRAPARVSVALDEPLEPMLHDLPRPPRAWPWAVGGLLALLALAAQAAYFYRVDLTIRYAELRPNFVALCARLGCDVPLPRRIKEIDIEDSDLHPDPATKGRLRLVAGLKNRAAFAQQYPDLELTLTDTLDRPLSRRVLAPVDYLPAGTDPKAGFAPQARLAINLTIDPSGLAASGYRLYVFYP